MLLAYTLYSAICDLKPVILTLIVFHNRIVTESIILQLVYGCSNVHLWSSTYKPELTHSFVYLVLLGSSQYAFARITDIDKTCRNDYHENWGSIEHIDH